MTDNGGLSTTDKVYGAIAAIAIVLALWFLVRGGGADTTQVSRAPRITIDDPRPHAEVDQPIVVTFDARSRLRPDGSDSAFTRHVHADVGATMLMPGPTDVQRVSGTTYRWKLASVPPGTTFLRLYWADAAHRPIPGAASDSVPIVVR
jgi:hypothetical protein